MPIEDNKEQFRPGDKIKLVDTTGLTLAHGSIYTVVRLDCTGTMVFLSEVPGLGLLSNRFEFVE